ncbi:uncharacterized protein LAESUDRAFT_727529 [Laetiporus sulphureus 93-53]|uniref:Phosphoesterase-domain-containing protein n=1 Tax=Laetiporus sulphureus 93-53 TaxID=1314785 RepID=A0A165DII1_9APHY|nr:uncharacterized protein LAESUDRAFT_727529 [Laetiporus sulphureus 93-53]KZT04956.1 hypothetical protein LAESUDRAFT_727529 [Laetiporus sulphureus 93-53]
MAPQVAHWALLAAFVAALVHSASAATAQNFQPPAFSPTSESTNYTGTSNGTIQNGPLVPGKVFDRFIQIWFENTDFETAASSPTFQQLTTQGVLFTSYYAMSHPSEPNYIAVGGGDFFGNAADDFRAIPENISSIVDLLEAKNISWSSYQESMPYDGFTGYNYTSYDYISGSGDYTYYVRKHNPLIIFDSVSNVTERALRIRNFNDFAVDVNASAVPQWTFITPNLVNDGHDTSIDFASQWIQYWLTPLLSDERFNDNRTIILLTFDETETYTINNRVWTLALGGGLPANLKNTTDDTFYTHYSCLSTVEANWSLDSLGRGDTNQTLNNVFSFVANVTGWKNNGIYGNSSAIPLLNITGTIPGPLNPEYYIPFTAPNKSAVSPGGGSVYVASGLNTSFTAADLPSPVNLTALGETLPWSVNPGYDYPYGTKVYTNTTTTSSSPTTNGSTSSGSSSGAVHGVVLIPGLTILGVIVGLLATL